MRIIPIFWNMRYTRLLRNVVLSLVIANILILIGKDAWWKLYQIPAHYLDMLVTFISVLIIFEYVDWINRYLNKQYLLTGNLTKRIMLQVVYGLVVPAGFAIVFTFIMWEFLWHQHLIKDGYFKYEFLPQVLMMIVVNLFFVVFDLFKKATYKSPEITLLAQKGKRKIPMVPGDIALIQLKNGLVYLISTGGEQLLLSDKLDAFENLLPQEHFFRANRQVILNKKACRSFRSIENGKIAVELLSTPDPIIVSQKRAASFRSWISS
jgi:hypothetical protein